MGGQVKHPLPSQQVKQLSGLSLVVDDHQGRPPPHPFRQRGIVQLPDTGHLDPAQFRIKLRGIRRDFAGRCTLQRLGAGQAIPIMHRWLGRSTQHNRTPIAPHQFIQRRQTRAQECQRQALRLVQNDHRFGDVVQLATFLGSVGKQAFEKLHSRCDNHRTVPILGRQPHFLGAGFVEPLFCLKGRVMLQNGIFVAKFIPENLCGLVDDGGIRGDVNHPPHVMRNTVIQRKGQRA